TNIALSKHLYLFQVEAPSVSILIILLATDASSGNPEISVTFE
ncbi:unnamed protein product, partial [marine sediment metagenome]